MTLEDIKNAGYKLLSIGNHQYQIYDGFSYHGMISVNDKRKFFYVTNIKDCPLYMVQKRVKNIDELKTLIEKYFPVDCSEISSYYDMYNEQIVEHYRVECFVRNILRNYGFEYANAGQWEEYISYYKCYIGHKRQITIAVDSKNYKLTAYFGDNSYVEDTFVMWDEESVKNTLSNVLTVPIITEIGLGFKLLTKIPMATKTPDIKTNALEMFGEKPDDVKTILENVRDNINNFLATL